MSHVRDIRPLKTISGGRKRLWHGNDMENLDGTLTLTWNTNFIHY